MKRQRSDNETAYLVECILSRHGRCSRRAAMNFTLRIYFRLASIVAIGASACLPKGPVYPAGTRLVVVEDSILQQVQGTTLEKINHRDFLRGGTGPVVAHGASVEVVDENDPYVANTGKVNGYNPWIFVKV